MFIHLRLYKKIIFSKKKNIFIFKRNLSVVKSMFFQKNIFITNSLTWIKYNNKIINNKYKYGMFSFTRKPFTKPAKRISKKKR